MQKEILKEIILSQQEYIQKLDLGTIRDKKDEIKITDSFVLIVTGVRRCGKSTLLSQILKKQQKWYYLNLEDPRLNEFKLEDFNTFEDLVHEIYGFNGIYFFDEIQNISQWEKFIRYLVDKKEKVVVTGSNASLLSQELGTKLTGRHLQVELFPFSFKEFLNMNKLKPSIESFEKYFVKGGFPEYLKKDNPTILNELLSDIVMKDIAIRFGIKNTIILNKIVIYLISNVGKEFSYNSIKKMFGIKSVQSVINYISYFENAYLVFTVPRFSYSFKQQQIFPKKIYSIDNGFSYCNTASFSKDKGKMLENIVFLSLRKKYKEIFYFQDENECDFLIKEKEKITQAIQVCYHLDRENLERELNGLKKAMSTFKLTSGLIITFNQEDKFDDIKAVPIWKWLSGLLLLS